MSEVKPAEIKKTSSAVYMQLGCRDYARIDLRPSNEVLHISDFNPKPDIRPETNIAYVADAARIGDGVSVDQLIRLASTQPWGRQKRLSHDTL